MEEGREENCGKIVENYEFFDQIVKIYDKKRNLKAISAEFLRTQNVPINLNLVARSVTKNSLLSQKKGKVTQ